MNTKLKIGMMALLGALSVNPVLAQEHVGNGGDGILIANKPYLLDLIEYSSHKNNVILPGTCDYAQQIESGLSKELKSIPLRKELTSKLIALCAIDSKLALATMVATNRLLFSWVDLSLVDIKDEDTSLNYDPKSLVQLAVRKEYHVSIDQGLWSRLDLRNQSALILHEVFYAMLKPASYIGKMGAASRQNSAQARAVVGALYSGQLSILDPVLQDTILSPIRNKMYYREDANKVLATTKDGRFGYFTVRLLERSTPYDANTYYSYAGPQDLPKIPEIAKKYCTPLVNNPKLNCSDAKSYCNQGMWFFYTTTFINVIGSSFQSLNSPGYYVSYDFVNINEPVSTDTMTSLLSKPDLSMSECVKTVSDKIMERIQEIF